MSTYLANVLGMRRYSFKGCRAEQQLCASLGTDSVFADMRWDGEHGLHFVRMALEAVAGVDVLVAKIHSYAGYHCAMALDKEEDGDLAPALRDLGELNVAVAIPFLLEFYDEHRHGDLPKKVSVTPRSWRSNQMSRRLHLNPEMIDLDNIEA